MPTTSQRVEPVRVAVPGTGPEDVVVTGDGLMTGLADGRVLAVDVTTGSHRVITETSGRPLGLESAPDGRLVVCDARRGLLAVDTDTGAVEVLVDTYRGEGLRFCNNAAVAPDGTIYFSDSSRRHGIDDWRGELLEHSGTGRLFRRTPDGAVDVVADGLQFANGVALAPDASFVVVAETGAYRLRRVWLTGDRAGRVETFLELPGFPDNLSTGTDGLIWVALPNPRDPVLDRLLRTPRTLRRVVGALPTRLQPAPKKSLRAMAIDSAGSVVHDLTGPSDVFCFVTGVREHRGRLHLGSLLGDAFAVADVPTVHR